MYYINNFFLYSIVGHIFESIIYLFCSGESGILYGPWTPVYGIGVVIIFLFYRYFVNKNYSKNKIMFNIFFVGFLLLTLIEFIGGYLLEWIFDVVFWNYESLMFNIGKYISLETSIAWGIASILAIKFFKPITDKIENKIPVFITWVFIVLFLIDVLLTLILKTNYIFS